ncbi:MAG: SsrA-binding protein SmpB [Candidatus Eisenbacteria bacterium]|nr:SsrA-binding protein SmpB [Candidatus Eisenbacteria bacterium]
MAEDVKLVAKNRRARHDYHVEDTVEAGVVLKGTEVKSVRLGKIQLVDSYARVEDGEMFLHGVHISPYKQGNRFNVDPRRVRKLLLHKNEIRRLHRQVREKGVTLIPLSVYLRRGRVKVEIGLCRGKRQHDKRETIKRRDAERDMERELHRRDRNVY